jgi:hypothetical protein
MDIARAGRTTGPLLSANGGNVYVVWSQTIGTGAAQNMEATSTTAGANFSQAVQITTGSNESISLSSHLVATKFTSVGLTTPVRTYHAAPI